ALEKQNATDPEKTTPTLEASAPRRLLPLPAPNSDGVIRLSERGPYESASIEFTGDLKIRGAIGVNPEIHVEDTPLTLSARSVTLEQLTIRHVNDSDPAMLVKVRSHGLEIANCDFVSADPNTVDAARG